LKRFRPGSCRSARQDKRLEEGEEIARALQKMRTEAEETEQRCSELIGSLVQWALPIQEHHLSEVKECSLMLAEKEDPNG
jgi:hypothetical protein